MLINIMTMTWSWPSSHHSRKLGWCNIPVNMYIAWRSRLFSNFTIMSPFEETLFYFQSSRASMSFHTMPWHNMLQIGNLIRFRIKKENNSISTDAFYFIRRNKLFLEEIRSHAIMLMRHTRHLRIHPFCCKKVWIVTTMLSKNMECIYQKQKYSTT